MSDPDEVFDSPTSWVAQHIHEYIESGGREGHSWRGYPALLLTTRGRKTGRLRRTALIYGQDGDRYMIVASRGGHSHHPSWYLNLSADPAVQVQVEAEKFAAQARVVSGDERARLWKLMASIYPPYDDYQARTRREIPVIVLTRTP